MPARPCAAAASSRNAAPIAGVLSHELRHCSTVFEIGSGTGQHAIEFAGRFDHLEWQTSDLRPNHVGIREWIEYSGLANVLAPIAFDALTADPPEQEFDAVFSANTAHIMSHAAARRMVELVGRMLTEGGRFCLYGPFRRFGRFNTKSNAAFDASLRARNPEMGLRDLEELQERAAQSGMTLSRVYAMPSNNLCVVWRKERTGDE
jgi:cyclopropane fatty-acyl-phospholipid synthase-like methyltransferase